MGDGFTTRAIRAATRVPRVDQPPSWVPVSRSAAALAADLVVEPATNDRSDHSDVVAGVVAGSVPLIAAIRALHVDMGGVLASAGAVLVEAAAATPATA